MATESPAAQLIAVEVLTKHTEVIEFLRLLPAYRTTDPELLERRLRDLKNELTKRDTIKDLLIYAQLQNQKPDNEEEKDQ